MATILLTLSLTWPQTVEATRLQVGDDPSFPVNLVISTLAEGEFLLEALKQYKNEGRQVNVRFPS